MHGAPCKVKKNRIRMPNESEKVTKKPASAPPAWKKPSRLTDEGKKKAKYRREYRRRLTKREGGVALTPLQSQWLVQYLTNGNNAGAAAEAVGMSRTTGNAWARLPQVRAMVDEFQVTAGATLEDWGRHLRRAQDTLVSLLDSSDERVRLQAVQTLLDRGLGKVASKVDATVTHQNALSEPEMQAALSLMAAHSMTFTEASQYVRDNPDEVRAWLQAQATQALRLGPGPGGT
jgi:hypothetical protein